MINQVIDLTGLIISIFGMIQVWKSRILERRSRRYFLGIISILIAYAVSDLISWLTYERYASGWILVSKTGLLRMNLRLCLIDLQTIVTMLH